MRNPITSMIKEYNSEKEFNKSEEKAIKMFDAQADAIRNIRTTDGYLQIKEFLKMERDAAIQRLTTTTKEDLPSVRALLTISDKLLSFLENREKDSPKLTS